MCGVLKHELSCVNFAVVYAYCSSTENVVPRVAVCA
jgi:hypothetical protein